jgi:hypothetical protein
MQNHARLRKPLVWCRNFLVLLSLLFCISAFAVDTDGDGVDDSVDAFPNDACASVDTDHDGKPDTLNLEHPVGNCLIDGFETGDFSANSWSNTGVGSTDWQIDTYYSHTGTKSAFGSGTSARGLSLTRNFPVATTLYFYSMSTADQWTLFGEWVPAGYVYIDGTLAGEIDINWWIRNSIPVPAGTHTITWYPGGACDWDSHGNLVDCVYSDLNLDDIAATPLQEDTDDDNDGMPDTWEVLYGLNPLNAADASTDLDGDGYSNLLEFLAHTDPTNAASYPHAVKNDFDRDGKSDVLFLNTSSGATQYWKSATKSQSVSPGKYDTTYTYAGAGDFDGDGKVDLFFVKASTHVTQVWSGAAKTAMSYPGTIAAGFSIAAICDVDGDGKDDVIWYSTTTGATRAWSGAVKTAVTYPGTQNPAYTVAACADFDGDGRADIYWHNSTTGANLVWPGARKAMQTNPGTISDLAYVPFGAGDIDRDGKADLVWYKASNGAITVWNAGLKSGNSYMGTNSTTYTPAAIGDYDGDGKADLLWVKASANSTQLWPGVVKAAATYPGTYAAGFSVQK